MTDRAMQLWRDGSEGFWAAWLLEVFGGWVGVGAWGA